MKLRRFSRPFVGAVLTALVHLCYSQTSPVAPAHTVSHFSFTVAAPFARVAPQFGPEAERAWGDPQWDPHFLYPQPGKDVAGAVFTLQHGQMSSVWVNTRYDTSVGRMQYVYLVADAMVCVIDVAVTTVDSLHTLVDVTYTRTALAPEHNAGIVHLSQQDAQSGPEWQRHVEHALGMDKP